MRRVAVATGGADSGSITVQGGGRSAGRSDGGGNWSHFRRPPLPYPVNYLTLGLSVNIRVTGSFLRYIGIRDLSGLKRPADAQESLASALGVSLDELRTLDSIARTELEFLRGSDPIS